MEFGYGARSGGTTICGCSRKDLHPVVDNEVDVPVVEDGPHAEAAQNGDDEEMVEIIEIADD